MMATPRKDVNRKFRVKRGKIEKGERAKPDILTIYIYSEVLNL